MRIALDAMGGDKAPADPVAGAVQAARELGIDVSLVGPRAIIATELARHRTGSLRIEIIDAPDVIDMAEHPVQAVRTRPNSSMNVAVRLVKEKAADGCVTAGNTGAAMVAALFGLGRLPHVERPALATIFPTQKGHCLILDVGANAECRPEHLQQFAVMGECYARLVLDVKSPRVGLVSNGEEPSKGPKLVQEAHELLQASPLNFIGNVEGKDIPAGLADVVVCDGFVGNVLVKFGEGIGAFTFSLLREEIGRSPIGVLGALLLRPSLRRIRRRVDYQEYGGAPLLGVRGVVIVAHGRSGPRAIRNAIRVAAQAASTGLPEALSIQRPSLRDPKRPTSLETPA